MTDAQVRLAGEDLLLLPERALFWPRAATLVAADFHWGKGATFRAAGIPIPTGTTSDDLARLDDALSRTCARRLIILGDLFHARAGRIASRTLADLREWRERRIDLEILLVRGNHDRHAGDPPDDLRINSMNAPAFVPPFVLRHEPAVSPVGCIPARCWPVGGSSGNTCPASGSRPARPSCPHSAASPVSAPCGRGRTTGSTSLPRTRWYPWARIAPGAEL